MPPSRKPPVHPLARGLWSAFYLTAAERLLLGLILLLLFVGLGVRWYRVRQAAPALYQSPYDVPPPAAAEGAITIH